MRACITDIKTGLFGMNPAHQGQSRFAAGKLHPDDTSTYNFYVFRHTISENRRGQRDIDLAKMRKKRRITAFLDHFWSRSLWNSFCHGAKIVIDTTLNGHKFV